jgi:TonB family protein
LTIKCQAQTAAVASLNSTVMRARNLIAVSLVSACGLAHGSGAGASNEIAACKPMPKILHAEQPLYPARESRVTVEGSVTLEFTVEKDGSVANPFVVANDPPDTADWFSAPALEAIAKFKFEVVAAPCIGRARIVFKVLPNDSTHNKSLEWRYAALTNRRSARVRDKVPTP